MNATPQSDLNSKGSPSRIQRVKEVVSLAAPASAAMFSYTLVGLIDTIMVGRLGPAALAGVGLSSSLVFTCGALLFGMVQAVTPLAAQNEGAGNKAKAGKYLHQATWIALIGGCALALFLGVFGSSLLALMEPGQQVIDVGIDYLYIRAIGAPLLFLIVARDSFFEALGDTKTPLKISLVTNVINAGLDALFIYGLGMGVAGAAWATLIAHGAAAFVYQWHLVHYHRKAPDYEIRPMLRPNPLLLKKVFVVGWPMGLQFFFDVGSWLMVSIFIGWLGQNSLAASQIVGRVISVALMVSHGITIASTSLVGRYLGAKRPEEALKYGWTAVGVGMIFTAVLSLLCISCPRLIAEVFTTDPEVISIAEHLLVTAMFLMFAETFSNGTYGILQGAGDTQYTMRATLFGTWGLGVPFAYILAFWAGLGADGVYIALGLQMAFISTLYVVRLRGHKWLDRSLVDSNEPETEESEVLFGELARKLLGTPEAIWQWTTSTNLDESHPVGATERDFLYDANRLH